MNKIFFFIILMFLNYGCSQNSGEVFMNPVNGAWNKNQKQIFHFEIKDARQAKNIIFVIRNNDAYPYSNLRVISKLDSEKGNSAKPDTLNYILAKPNGEWIGTGFGDTKETLFQYRMNYRFPSNGRYRIEVLQAMRRDNLPGIEDFGIKIENATP